MIPGLIASLALCRGSYRFVSEISGRSDITDFEEVVRLDKEYIENWDIGLDIKILLKTVMVVAKKDGSM